jgi:hypothetical protein
MTDQVRIAPICPKLLHTDASEKALIAALAAIPWPGLLCTSLRPHQAPQRFLTGLEWKVRGGEGVAGSLVC